MKKKLALILAATMIIGSMPMSAFAASENRPQRVITAKEDETLTKELATAFSIVNDGKDFPVDGAFKFELDLKGAEWALVDGNGVSMDVVNELIKDIKILNKGDVNLVLDGEIDVKKIEDTKIVITVPRVVTVGEEDTSSSEADIAKARTALTDAITAYGTAKTNVKGVTSNPTGTNDYDATDFGSIANTDREPGDGVIKATEFNNLKNAYAAGMKKVDANIAGNDTTVLKKALDGVTTGITNMAPSVTNMETKHSAYQSALSSGASMDVVNAAEAARDTAAKSARDVAVTVSAMVSAAGGETVYRDNSTTGAAMYQEVRTFNTALGTEKTALQTEYDAAQNNQDVKNATADKALMATAYNNVITANTRLANLTNTNASNDADKLSTKIDRIVVPMYVKATDSGAATVTVEPLESAVSQGTYTFMNVSEGSSLISIENTTNIGESATKIKPITISESTRNTFTDGSVIKFKLNSGFEFKEGADKLTMIDASGNGTLTLVDANYAGTDTMEFKYTKGASTTNKSKFVISNLYVVATDDAKTGDAATIVVSGKDIDKTTLDIGKYQEYTVSLKAEDKDLPVLYSGSFEQDGSTNDSLKVTFEEQIAKSWISSRKTTFTLPEGVKINSVDVKKADKIKGGKSEFQSAVDAGIDGNKITISGIEKTNETDKVKIEMVFDLSIDPGFTGDIIVKAGGAALSDEPEATIAKAELPVKITADTNEVLIDYRNVAVSDITITESFAGALEKDTTLFIQAEDMKFEDGMEFEVLEGDLKVESVKTEKGVVKVKIKSESSKTPAKIKLSKVKLYLDRTIPVGGYKLSVVAGASTDAKGGDDAFFKNYKEDVTDDDDKKVKDKKFETDTVDMVQDYIKVVTAGRDTDDSTFTTKLSVAIGAKEMKVGDKTVALETPAYISADGYTMLPVRAITEALAGSNGKAIVNWDNATRKVTIIYGSRIISMTIGSSMMTINGTDVPMSAKAVITDDYTFIPLRDLGYALGLSDSKINWDAATKTATLN